MWWPTLPESVPSAGVNDLIVMCQAWQCGGQQLLKMCILLVCVLFVCRDMAMWWSATVEGVHAACAGVVDMAQLVDRFLAQDSTHDALQQLQQEALAYLHHMHQRSLDLRVCLPLSDCQIEAAWSICQGMFAFVRSKLHGQIVRV